MSDTEQTFFSSPLNWRVAYFGQHQFVKYTSAEQSFGVYVAQSE